MIVTLLDGRLAAKAAAFSPASMAQSPASRSIRQALTDPVIRASFARLIAQLTAIAWMTGTWKARVITHIGPHRETNDAATYVFTTAMDGRWLFGADRARSDLVYITYDPLGKQWALVRMEANPSYELFVSKDGWRAGRITFVSAAAFANGQPYRRTTTIVKRNPNSFVMYDKERLADGTELLDDIVSFLKQ